MNNGIGAKVGNVNNFRFTCFVSSYFGYTAEDPTPRLPEI